MKNIKIHILVLFVLAVVTLGACSRGQGGAVDDHHHDESLRLTAYNNYLEVFAEITPFVVGQQSDILAHFTQLKDFRPLKSGKITVSLIVGTAGVRQSAEAPIRDGIYSFTIKPTTMGTGKLVFDISGAGGNSQIVIYDVKIFDNEHDAQHSAIAAVQTSATGVIFTKEQSWKLDFATEEVIPRTFGPTIRTIAQVKPSQFDERVIAAQTSGIVSFSSVAVVSGKAVNARQTLLTIGSSTMADNNINVRYAEAAAEYNRTKSDYERKKALATDKIVSEKVLIEAQTAFRNAEAVYNNLQRNFSLGRQAVVSPINGFVKQVLVRNGEFVEAGQPLLVVSQNRDLLIKAEVQPRFFNVLGSITSANIRDLNSDSVYTLEELRGSVVSYGRTVDLANPLIPVVFRIQNNPGFLPGSFVEMFIKLQTNEQAITIPNGGIIEEMGTHFAYVQITPEYFEKRSIRIGKTDGVRTEILSGVSIAERVVSEGAIFIKLSEATGAIDAHGHVH